jgi:hypothetical protein
MTSRLGRGALAALLAIACSGGGETTGDAPGPAPSARTYGLATTWLWFQDLAPTASGGFVAAANDGADAYVFEVDAAGAIVWAKRYDLGYADAPTSVRPVPGGFVVGGRTSSSGQAWVMKLDANGGIVWHRRYGYLASSVTTGPPREVRVRPTPDGGYVVAAVDQRMSNATYRPLLWLAKLDAAGIETWQYAYGDLWAIDGTLNALELASDGGYVLAGVDQGEALVAKVGADGALLWARWYGDAFGGANAVHEVPGVGYVVAGYRGNATTQITDPVLLALDANGALVWQRVYGGAESASAADVAPDADGGFLVTGWARVASSPFLLAMKVDAAGGIVWQRTYGDGNDTGGWIDRMSDGRWRVAGTGGAGTNNGVWVLELPADGAIAFADAALQTGTAGLARVADTLPSQARTISGFATAHASTTGAPNVSPATITFVEDAP